MADNFTANQCQGVFGEFKPVYDIATTASENNVQGIFGEFKPVLDEAAGGGPPPTPSGIVGWKTLLGVGQG